MAKENEERAARVRAEISEEHKEMAEVHDDTLDGDAHKNDDNYDFMAAENRKRAKRARKAAAAAARKAAREKRGGVPSRADFLAEEEENRKKPKKFDQDGNTESDSSDSDLEWRHGWDEHIPEESAISKKMEIRKFAQIQGEDEGIEDTLFQSSEDNVEDGKKGHNDNFAENLSPDEHPGLSKVFGNFEVTLVPKGYAGKIEAQKKIAAATRRREIAAAKRKHEFARRRAEEEGDESGIAAAMSAVASIEKALEKEKQEEDEAVARKSRGAKPRVEGEVDWKSTSPPSEIRKRAANAVAVTGDVDDAKWRIGHSLSLKKQTLKVLIHCSMLLSMLATTPV